MRNLDPGFQLLTDEVSMIMNRTHRKIFFILCALLTIVVATVAIARMAILNSESYAVASRYLRESPSVATTIGNVNSVELAWFGHSEIQRTDIDGKATGSANLSLVASGSHSSSEYDVDLILDPDGKWQVVRVAP